MSKTGEDEHQTSIYEPPKSTFDSTQTLIIQLPGECLLPSFLLDPKGRSLDASSKFRVD